MHRALVVCALAGCGRMGFGASELAALGDAGGPDTTDVAADAPLSACQSAPAIPSTVTFAGQTFEYTGFNNQTGPVPATTVTIYDENDQLLGSTVSDAAGQYSITFATGGIAHQIAVQYAPSGYWTTWITPDLALAESVTGPNMTRWQLGDGPVWNDGSMGSVYGSVGITKDPAKGTLNLAVRDCDGTPIEGVTFTIEPPAQQLAYIDAAGFPSTSLTSTVGPYASAMAFNAENVVATITATASGRQFLPRQGWPQPGNVVTYPAFYPVQ